MCDMALYLLFLQAAQTVCGWSIALRTDMTTTITWRQDRAPGRSQKDSKTAPIISAKKKSRYFPPLPNIYYLCPFVLKIILLIVMEWVIFLLLYTANLISVFSLCKGVVSSVTAEYNREQMWLANESLVTQLQARVRGYLFRKKHAERLAYLHQQEAHVITLQVAHDTVRKSAFPRDDRPTDWAVETLNNWKSYSHALQYTNTNKDKKCSHLLLLFIMIWFYHCNYDFSCSQASWKGYKQRKMYKDRLDILQKNVVSIVKVKNDHPFQM